MIYLRYGSQWQYSDRIVTAHFPNGVAEIPLCTQRVPCRGAFFISRRDEDQWVIAPARWTGFTARNVSFDKGGVHLDFLTLTGTPAGVSSLLSLL